MERSSRMSGSSIASTRMPQTTPVISVRFGLSAGASRMNASSVIFFAITSSSELYVWPVSQQITSSTSAFVRPFFSAFAM